MGDAILTIEGLDLWAQGKPVLRDASFALPATGMTALMGPSGAGKTILLNWLSGKADPTLFTAQVRKADYFHAPLARCNRPPLLTHRQRLGFRQMMQLLDVTLAANPPLICLDDPTVGLSPEEAVRVLDRLTLIARYRAVLLVSHNQREVQAHAQHVLLLAGGRVQENTPIDQFFSAAQTETGRHFVMRGCVALPEIEGPAPQGERVALPVPQNLGIRRVGCGGRLRAVLGDRVFLHDLPRSQALPRTDAMALAAAGIRTAATFAPLSRSDSLALLAYGLTGLRLPSLDPGVSLPALRTRCHVLRGALEAEGALVFLRRPDDRQVGFAVSVLLVSLGTPADQAARIGRDIDGLDQPDPARTNRLCDLELSLNLQRAGADPDALAVGSANIAWIEPQATNDMGAAP